MADPAALSRGCLQNRRCRRADVYVFIEIGAVYVHMLLHVVR